MTCPKMTCERIRWSGFIEHQNCSLELAIKISTTSDPVGKQPAAIISSRLDNICVRRHCCKVAEITKKQLQSLKRISNKRLTFPLRGGILGV